MLDCWPIAPIRRGEIFQYRPVRPVNSAHSISGLRNRDEIRGHVAIVGADGPELRWVRHDDVALSRLDINKFAIARPADDLHSHQTKFRAKASDVVANISWPSR